MTPGGGGGMVTGWPGTKRAPASKAPGAAATTMPCPVIGFTTFTVGPAWACQLTSTEELEKIPRNDGMIR